MIFTGGAPEQMIREGFPGQRMVVLPRSVVSAWLENAPLFDMLPSDVGYFPSAKWHFVDRPNGASQLILIYCEKGVGWVRVGNYRAALRRGQLAVIPPGIPHSYGSEKDNPWSIHWVHIAGSRTANLVQRLELSPGSFVISPGQDPALPTMFDRLVSLLSEGYLDESLEQAATEFHRIATHLIVRRHWQAGRSGSLDARIRNAIELMSHALDRSLTLPEFAESANMSVSHFAALFKKRTGFPPLDYFNRLKLQRACHLLDTTDLSVKEIAAGLGFKDQLYFSRRFRKVHNCSPIQYRAIQKG